MSELPKAYLKEMARLLGGSQTAVRFATSFDGFPEIWGADNKDPCSGRPAQEQYEKLNRILEAADELLKELKKIQYEEGEDLELRRPDYQTAMELRTSFQQLQFDQLVKIYPSGPARGEAHIAASNKVPINYPSALIKELIEMRAAAHHAAARIKPGPGRSSKNRKEAVLQNTLAKNFVFRYRSTFGHFVPIRKDGPEHNAFQILLHEAKLSGIFGPDGHRESEDGNFSLLRKCIEADIAIFDNDPEIQEKLTKKREATYRKRERD